MLHFTSLDELSFEIPDLASDAVWTLPSDANSGQHHHAPPEALNKTPLAGRVSLGEVDQAGKGENTDKKETH